MTKKELLPTPKLRWLQVGDHSGRPMVTEFTHYRDGDGWVLQQWWESETTDGEWRDVPIEYDYSR